MKRPRRFTMNLSEREAEMLRALAADAGLDQADVLRGDVRRQYEERFGRGGPVPLSLTHSPKPMA